MANYVLADNSTKREAADNEQPLAIIVRDVIAGVKGKVIDRWEYSDRITSTYVDANPKDSNDQARKCNHGLIPVIEGTRMDCLAMTDWALARQTTNHYSAKDTYEAKDLKCLVRQTYLAKCLEGLKTGKSSPREVLMAVAEELKGGKCKCSSVSHTIYGTRRNSAEEYHGDFEVFTTEATDTNA